MKSEVTPERKAEIRAKIERVLGLKSPPRPKVVTRDGTTVRDADVHVSRVDPNVANAVDGVVAVRRPDFVTINMAAYEEQQAARARKREESQRRDPYRLGLYGEINDDQ
jgi:hypothetical protein